MTQLELGVVPAPTPPAPTGDSFWCARDVLAESEPTARRLGLPTGGDVIAAWCAPERYWLPRIERALPDVNTWTRGRAVACN